MEIIVFLSVVIAVLAMLISIFLVQRVKKQITEMTDALMDVKSGNGNRRILSVANELVAPLAYEINEIVVSYERRLSIVRQTTENGIFELPPKEFDLLLYCAKHQGKILTKQQIYEAVWGEEYCYDDSNIMAIISRLRKKLEANPSSPKYIQTVKGIGYRFNKEV